MSQPYDLLITTFPLFQGFTPQGAQMVLEAGSIKEFESNQLVFKEGDPAKEVVLVLTGKLKVFVQRDGRELALTESGPGTIVGELAVLCGLPRAASVQASEKSAVLVFTSTSFRRLLLRNAFLSEKIFASSMSMLIEKERSLIDSLQQKRS